MFISLEFFKHPIAFTGHGTGDVRILAAIAGRQLDELKRKIPRHALEIFPATLLHPVRHLLPDRQNSDLHVLSRAVSERRASPQSFHRILPARDIATGKDVTRGWHAPTSNPSGQAGRISGSARTLHAFRGADRSTGARGRTGHGFRPA